MHRLLSSKRLLIDTLPRRGWVDGSELLIHSAFQILVNFIEGDDDTNWDGHPDHKTARTTMLSLYHWWKEVRPTRTDPLDSVTRIPPLSMILGGAITEDTKRASFPEYYTALDESTRLEQVNHDEDQENLHRLISIRDYLWT